MQPDLNQIQELRKQGNVIPVYKSVVADFLTPVSAFLKLEKNQPYACLLESVEGGETIARYSFLGCDPFSVCRYRKGDSREFLQTLRVHPGARLVAPRLDVPDRDLPELGALFAALRGRRFVHAQQHFQAAAQSLLFRCHVQASVSWIAQAPAAAGAARSRRSISPARPR